MSHVRPRWAAIPLALTLALPVVAALPASASADAAPEFHGSLVDSAAGTRYIAYDAAGTAVFTSPVGAVDGALGAVTTGGPTVAYVAEQDTATSYIDRLHVVTPGGADSVVYTATAGKDVSEPAVSPDGSAVLFALDDDTTSALLAVDTRSDVVRTVRQSTQTSYAGPSFSPDGSWISWAQATGSRSDVVTARFATGAATVVASTISDTRGYLDTAWSPDGRMLAVSYAAGADGTPVTSLERIDTLSRTSWVLVRGYTTSTGAVSYGEPTWSADGRSGYASQVTETGDNASFALVRLPTADNTVVEPVAAAGYAGSPSFAGAPLHDDVAPAPVNRLAATLESSTAHVSFQLGADSDVADFVVTRSEGAPADTPTATIEVARTRATLLDVPLPKAGTDYGLSVFTRDWSGNLSPAASVSVSTPPATTVSMTASVTRVTYRQAIRFSGKLLAGTTPVRDGSVMLYVRRANTASWRANTGTGTAADGSYVISYTPDATAEYQVRYEGSGTPVGYPSESAKKVVSVVPLVSAAVSASRTTLGRTVTVAGGVAPAHVGQVVDVQRYVGHGAWRTIATTRLSSTSQYRYLLKPGSRGTWQLRVVKRADGDHLLAISPTRTLYVG